jgi:molybdopterin-guanine dinucleotide biosynthesis protein A
MGRPKAWLPFGDEVLLQRTVRILAEVVEPIVVVAAPDQSLPSLSKQVRIARDDREFLGPLNGLATGLASLGEDAQVAYLSSCDVPFLRPAFVRRVIEDLRDADICIPEVGGYRHPLAAAYRTNLIDDVRSLIDAGRLRPVFLSEVRRTRVLTESDFADVDPELVSLRNVNTIEEYRAALRDAGYAPAGPE